MKQLLTFIFTSVALYINAQVPPQATITVTTPETYNQVTNTVVTDATNAPGVVSHTTTVSVTTTTNPPVVKTMTAHDFIQQSGILSQPLPAILTTTSVTNTTTTTTTPVPQNIGGVQSVIGDYIANIDESSNLFTHGEVEFRIGGVYVQKTGEGGTLLSVEKWDVGISNLCVGAEGITSGQNQAAEFGYVGYRHTIGNVAGALIVGMGYSDIDKSPLGVVGGRVEHRSTKHLGEWVSVSYGIELHQKNSRGQVIGAGINYSF
jgi:hypothetical protein